MDKKDQYKISDLIVISIILIIAAFSITNFIGKNDGFTIQDVYVYCGKNPEVLITHRGDDCNITMNKIYGENENWTRWRDLS